MKYFIKNEREQEISPPNTNNKGIKMEEKRDKAGRPPIPEQERRVALRSGRIKPETLEFINGMIDENGSFGKSIDELVFYYRNDQRTLQGN